MVLEDKDYNISIKSDISELGKVEQLIETVSEQLQIAEDNFGNILIAVTEAVNNAIHHGNQENPDLTVDVRIRSVSGKGLEVEVTDHGDGFDFDNLPDPTDPNNLENPDGRGVFLMRALSDEVEFNEKGNVVTLRFSLQ